MLEVDRWAPSFFPLLLRTLCSLLPPSPRMPEVPGSVPSSPSPSTCDNPECSSLAFGCLQPRPFSGPPDLSSLSLKATVKALSSLQHAALQLLTRNHNLPRGCRKPSLGGQWRLLGGGGSGAEQELAGLGRQRAYPRSGEHHVQRHLGK